MASVSSSSSGATRIGLLAILCAALLMTFSLLYGRITPRSQAITLHDLQVDDVHLGELHIGDVRTLSTKVVNRSEKTLHLDAPITSCGCISLNRGPLTLYPQERVDVPFRFTAPMEPQVIDRMLVLRSSDDPAVAWTIRITGNTTADVWAKPARLSLTIGKGQLPSANLVLHTKPGINVKRITSDSTALKLRTLEPQNQRQAVVVSLSEDAESKGEAVVGVVTREEDNVALQIKVNWSPYTKFRCVPQTLRLGENGEARNKIRRTVLIRGLTAVGKEDVTCTPLVDWVKVDNVELVDRLARVELTCDITDIPTLKRFKVLQLCVARDGCRVIEAATSP